MANLAWCKKQIQGIRLIEPNRLIANDYLRKAEGSLAMVEQASSEEWKAVGAYYAVYEAFYALLQETGIKCEIHDCTLALLPFFSFTAEEIQLFHFLKEQRINAQYYVDRKYIVAQGNKVKALVLACRQKMEELDLKRIREVIRKG